MNSFTGEITAIEQEESLSLISLRVGETPFTTIVIDTPDTAPYLRVGNTVQVLFKESEVLIGKDINNNSISLQNKIACTIKAIEQGKLLSKLELESNIGPVVSIITTNAVEQLQLKVANVVMAMVKTNEIMLAE
ncbi:molybdopterin-binding protein [Pontibacter silvestris]|uniref:Molybdopterin-binding protein n=1 Tax=Pontibacter silvestris TaxID=2305183 RepID=A0ABW4WVN9_9BACT|nr:TOBE domain-containing protein [Pontibacter silvestris]MCC9136931.1 TOBE domain-containing protein [Pontibacter silvestris]